MIALSPIQHRQCREGYFAYNSRDQWVGRSLHLYGEFSHGEASLFKALIRPGATVVEAGANIGALTVPIAKAAGPTGLVMAFEPLRLNYHLLCANIELNNLHNSVRINRAALGSLRGLIRVPVLNPELAGNYGGVSLLKDHSTHPSVESVPQLRLDEFDLKACHLIKCDVEGMEIQVLQGAAETIRAHRPILFVENDRAEHSTALIALLHSFGYQCWHHYTPLFNPNNYRGLHENLFDIPEAHSINLLCFHQTVTPPAEIIASLTRATNQIETHP